MTASNLVGSLYDELGVDPSSDQEELRRAYRQRARELHPDVNGSPADDSGMQRLNAAWAVLGEAGSRARYDHGLDDRVPPPGAPGQAHSSSRPAAGGQPNWAQPVEQPDPSLASGCLHVVLRPSFLILAVLFVIFVVTAYANHPGSTSNSPTTSTTPAASAVPVVPAAALVGSCIRDSADSVSFVPCTQRPNSLVIATMPASGLCPTGTTAYLVAGQTEKVCAQPNNP